MHKKDQGKLGEALVMAQAIDNGCAAFTEFGDNSKVDLIIEDSSGNLHKVQVKHMKRDLRQQDVTMLYMYKGGPNSYGFTYTERMVDWFAVVDDVTKKIAWINVSQILKENGSTVSLRHQISKRQAKNIRMFADYTEYPF